jgi:uncharacterized protein
VHTLDGALVVSPTDLTGFLACTHLTQLEMRAANGEVERPSREDAELDVLTRRGEEHETRHLGRLEAEGRRVVSIASMDTWTRADLEAAQAATVAAMRDGADVIYQATFFDGRWRGHADFLLRVETPSELGPYSYEVADTKLARSVRVGALLQMSNYSEHLAGLQGVRPANMHVILGHGRTESFPVNDFAAYYRSVKARFEEAIDAPPADSYPDPVDHCGMCRWIDVCDARRRDDDHLTFVARMSRNQSRRLTEVGVGTMAALAASPDGLHIEGVGDAVVRGLQLQARLQVQERETGEPKVELLPPEDDRGFAALPAPSPADLFFDMEGDPFAADFGLEYLFGVTEIVGDRPLYRRWWGHDEAGERKAFEDFIDFAIARVEAVPDLHIYHYAAYERTRITSLAGRYGTREDEVDRLLRGGVLVDLYQVVRQGIRVSKESYSIKKLEAFYDLERAADVGDAVSSIVAYEEYLRTANLALLEGIERYNEEDCVSTWRLRDWLEGLRAKAGVQFGQPIPRPEPQSQAPGEAQAEAEQATATLKDRLLEGIPEERGERSAEQQATWLLAQLLDWHRRESRSQWWAYFRRTELSDEDLVRDREAIGELVFEQEMEPVKKSRVYRYRFDPTQVYKLGVGSEAHDPRTKTGAGEIVAIDALAGTLDLKRGQKSEAPHPTSLIPGHPVKTVVQREAVARVAEDALRGGIAGTGPDRAIRDLLLRARPRLSGDGAAGNLAQPGENPVDAARRLVMVLDGGYLPVQGPPGSGKTWAGGRMILDLVRAGLRVGITATSHKAICNLLESACRFAREEGVDLRAMQRAPEADRCGADVVRLAKDNGDVDAALAAREIDVVAGTSWLLARAEMAGQLDVLFIDEAGQMSMADVVAVSTATRNLVLLGDPQQLAHPSQGIHPPGSGVSALELILDEAKTISPDAGVFLDRTFRMHPEICDYISEIAYEERLFADPSCALQGVADGEPLGGTGVRLVEVEHRGNSTVSPEEIATVGELFANVLGRPWTDATGATRPLRIDDILVVAPYNAQVSRLIAALPAGARVGTVDKFQGQEAPVVLYSLTSSSQEDMPRGMEFVMNLHRLNVAMSRARCLSVLVCSPAIMRLRCRTPGQMRLANAFCRLVEVAQEARIATAPA